MAGMTATQIILILIIVAAAALLQAFLGFGLPIVVMAALPFFIEYSRALAIAQAVGLVSTAIVALRFRKSIRFDILIPVMIPSLLIQVIATIVSVRAAGKVLFVLLGVLLIMLSLYYLAFSDRIVFNPTKKLSLGVGLVCGVSAGLFAINGPQAALYLLPAVRDKKEYLATIQAFFAFTNLEATVIRAILGSLTFGDLPLLFGAWTAMLAGMGVGFILFKNVKTAFLKKAVYLFIGIVGVWIIVSRVLGLA